MQKIVSAVLENQPSGAVLNERETMNIRRLYLLLRWVFASETTRVIGLLGFVTISFAHLSVRDVQGGLIPRANWRLWYVDSEETAKEDGVAENAFDGDSATIGISSISLLFVI